jgi:hypothetical protein
VLFGEQSSLRYMVHSYHSEEGEKSILIPSSKSDYVNYYEELYSEKRYNEIVFRPRVYDIKDKGDIGNFIDEIKNEITSGLNFIKKVAYKANCLIHNEVCTSYPNEFTRRGKYV